MKEYRICDFGAKVCDRLQTKEIQAAIDACFLAGGGRVVIPAGIFLTGGIRLRSHVTLYLESGAILRGSRDCNDYSAYLDDELEPIAIPEKRHPSDSVYPYSRWNNGLIKVVDAENVSIIGERGSYIDGANCFDPLGEGRSRGPHAINIQNSKNIYLEGYTVTDSANWAHAIFNTQGITVKNIKVLGGHDGFDIRTCDDVLIENCEFYTGDDCVAGFDNKNVAIRNCVFDCACSAIRFGGTDVLIENCKGIAPSSFGFRGHLTEEEQKNGVPTGEHCRHTMHTAFQYYCDFRADIRYAPGNIVVRNCDFENPKALFLHIFDGEHVWCSNRALGSITFENCSFTGLTEAGVLCSDKDEPLDFRLKNVRITSGREDADFPIFEAKACKYIELENVSVEGFKDPHIVSDRASVVKIKGNTSIEVVERETFSFSNPYVENMKMPIVKYK